MQKLFKKELWKDIFILVILIGVTFFRYTTFKEIVLLKCFCYSLACLAAAYGLVYTVFNCKTNKERKWLVALYSVSLLFMYHKDSFEAYIYILVAAIFIENREEFLRTYFVTSVAIICLAIICYFFELIPANDGFRGELPRLSLGFVHPNTIFRYFFGSLIALYIMDKKKTVFNIYAISMSVPLYLLTNSRTGLICSMVFVVLANMAIVLEKKLEKFDLRYGYLIFTLFSLVFIPLFHDSEILNGLLSGRPGVLYELLINAKWHILYGNMEYVFCDNRVVYLLVKNGCVSLILVNAFYYFVFRKETSIELKVVFVMSMIYGLTENFRGLGQTMVPVLCLWSLCDNYMKNKGKIIDKNLQKNVNNDNI